LTSRTGIPGGPGVKAKIHYTRFPVASPQQQVRANLLRTCRLCCRLKARPHWRL